MALEIGAAILQPTLELITLGLESLQPLPRPTPPTRADPPHLQTLGHSGCPLAKQHSNIFMSN